MKKIDKIAVYAWRLLIISQFPLGAYTIVKTIAVGKIAHAIAAVVLLVLLARYAVDEF